MLENLRPILLAEDNLPDSEPILAAFRESRLRNAIVLTRDGQAALEYFVHAGRASRVPANVALDLKMPRVDGREVRRAIRQIPEHGPIPLVILTSSKEESDLQQPYALGANAYVKTVALDEFIGVGKLGIVPGLLSAFSEPNQTLTPQRS